MAPKSKKVKKGRSNPPEPPLTKQQKRKATKERRQLIQTLSSTGVFALIVALILFLVGGPKAAIAGGGGILVLVLSYQYPNLALWAFLFYLPLNGTITYTVGGGSPIFQVAKDAFYIPALITLIKKWRRQKLPFLIPKEIKLPLTILLIFCALTWLLVNGSQQFSPNPQGKPLLLGILGLKVFLGYLPLITCAYYQIKNKRDILFLTRTQLAMTLFCCICGIIQYFLLEKGYCVGTRNKVGEELYKAALDSRCIFGGSLAFSPEVDFIRLPGTFVSPWHWAWFLISNAFFTFASTFSDPSLLWRIGGLIGMVLVLVNAVISGQRIALALVPISMIILLILTGQIARLKRFLPIALGLAIVISIALITNPDIFESRIASFTARWEAAPPTEFINQQFNNIYARQQGILGKGLGRATNSARILGETELVETYYPKIMYEIGPFGMLAFFVLVTTLTVTTFKAYRSVKEPNLRGFGAAFWVFILLISYNTYWYPLDTDPVAVYYWYLIGVTLKLPEIDKQENQDKILPK